MKNLLSVFVIGLMFFATSCKKDSVIQPAKSTATSSTATSSTYQIKYTTTSGNQYDIYYAHYIVPYILAPNTVIVPATQISNYPTSTLTPGITANTGDSLAFSVKFGPRTNDPMTITLFKNGVAVTSGVKTSGGETVVNGVVNCNLQGECTLFYKIP